MQRERFITMASNSDVEVNLGPAPLHSNSRFVIEDLVPANLDNAPHAQQENKSPRYVRNGPRPEVSERGAPRQRQEPALRSHRRVIRLLGGNSTRKESNITDRRRAPDTETFPSFLRRDDLPSGPPAMDPLEHWQLTEYNTEVAELHVPGGDDSDGERTRRRSDDFKLPAFQRAQGKLELLPPAPGWARARRLRLRAAP